MSEEQDELEAAYEELNHAIRKVVVHEGLDVNHGMVTDWVLVTAIQGFNNDGDPQAMTLTLVPPASVGGGIPGYRVVGLLDVALNELRYEIAAPYQGSVEEE